MLLYYYNSKSSKFNLVCDIVIQTTKTTSFNLEQFCVNLFSISEQQQQTQLIKSVVVTNKLSLKKYEKIRFPVLGIDILSAYGEIT
jgi:hypothetical protein